MKVRFGYSASHVREPDEFLELVDDLDRLQFDSVWLAEILGGPTPDPMSALGIAAGRVSRLKLGSQIVVPGRQPARLAKECATLDRFSGGRFLLTFVPGLEDDDEIARMGVPKTDRGHLLEAGLLACRQSWANDELRPGQTPLEVWLGGLGPKALERCGRVGDGWIPGLCTPEHAGKARLTILEHASRFEREFSDEHFGANVLYSTGEPSAEILARLAARRQPGIEVNPRDLVPTSWPALRSLIDRYLQAGFSKFVLRSASSPTSPPTRELEELAAEILPLQS